MKVNGAPASLRLPDRVKALFWEYDAEAIDWESDRDLVIRRVLSAGDWEAIMWLRSAVGDDNLRVWIDARQGDQLSAQQLRFWELILDLPGDQVDAWIASRQQAIWEKRTAP